MKASNEYTCGRGMRVRALVSGFVVTALLAGSLAWAASKSKQSAFAGQSAPEKASMTILALSSSSRQTFAGNQEIYLADLEIKGQHTFVRLIDQYPGFGLPVRTSLIRNRTTFRLLVTREPECDLPGAQIYLPPGDAGIFNGAVRDSLAERKTESVPCYKALHQTIAIAKK